MIRRQFLKTSLLTAATLALAGAHEVWANALKLIDMSGKTRKDKDNETAVKTAKGLGYVEDLKKALKDKKVTKVDQPGFKADQQTCEKCQFYKEVKKGEGTCTLIPKVLVHGPGSCNTWVKKS
jgi:hypothetical protein